MAPPLSGYCDTIPAFAQFPSVTLLPVGVGCQSFHEGSCLALFKALTLLMQFLILFDQVAETALVEIGPRLALQVGIFFPARV